MIRRSLTLISLTCLALALSACATPGLAELTAHLNERGCATKGSATASASLTGANLAGNVSWACDGQAPHTGTPEKTSAPADPPL